MRALTLHRPWAWAVVAGHKTIENRSWAPPDNLVSEPFAIHAGRYWDADGARLIRRILGLEDLPTGDPLVEAVGVIGVATLDRVARSNAEPEATDHPGRLTDSERRWYFGPYGWVLRDVVRLDQPVTCRGYQKLWTLPTEVEAEVRRQLAVVQRRV